MALRRVSMLGTTVVTPQNPMAGSPMWNPMPVLGATSVIRSDELKRPRHPADPVYDMPLTYQALAQPSRVVQAAGPRSSMYGTQSVTTVSPPQYVTQPRFVQSSAHSFTQIKPERLAAVTGESGMSKLQPGQYGYGNSYNMDAFDGPYLTNKYSMSGIPESRVFGVDYPYDMDRYGGLRPGETASEFFMRAMDFNVLFDRDEMQTNNLKLSSAPSISMSFGSGSGATGSGRYSGRGFGFGF
jgi:hypothetical protein